MKKLLASLLLSLMVAAGLVAAAPQPAQAACPYGGCIATTTSASGPSSIARRTSATFTVKVRAASNAKIRGQIVFVVSGNNLYRRIVKNVGSTTKRFVTPELKRGTYSVRVRFVKKQDSIWTSSGASRTLTVR